MDGALNCRLNKTLLFLAERSQVFYVLMLNTFRPTFHFAFKGMHSWHSIDIYANAHTHSVETKYKTHVLLWQIYSKQHVPNLSESA